MSAAGLRTAEDLDRALFQASVKIKVPGLLIESSSVLARAALRWLKVEPDDIELRADLTSDTTVIFVDDVERYGGKFDDLFGFIVNLVEASRLHVVLIADEGMAHQRFKKYGVFKEKIVGSSIAIPTSTNKFVSQEIEGLRDERTRNALRNSTEQLTEIFDARDMKNLRTLRAIIRELDSVVSSLDSQHKNINLSKLIPAVCFWRAAIAGNSENAALIRSAFTSTDLGLILSLSKGEKSAVESGNRDPNPLVALLDSTGFLVDAYEFPHSPSFANYIVDVTPDFEAIAKDFDLLPLVPHDDSSESALTALQRYRGYADDEVQSLIHIVWDQLENYQYDSLDEINAAYRTLNMMSGKRLTTFSQEELADFALTKLMSYPVEHLKSAYFEDFGLNLDPIDIRVANELSALAHRFDERQRELKKLAAIDWVLTGEGESPDVVSGPIFEELDPNLFYQQLVAAGPKAIHRAATLFGARLQITNASTYVAGDSDFAGALSNIIRASIPKDGQLKLRDSEFVRLSEVLAKFRDRMISG